MKTIKAIIASAVIILGMAAVATNTAAAAPAANAQQAQSAHGNSPVPAAHNNGTPGNGQTFAQADNGGLFNFLSHFFGNFFNFLQHLFQIIFGGGGGPGPSVTP